MKKTMLRLFALMMAVCMLMGAAFADTTDAADTTAADTTVADTAVADDAAEGEAAVEGEEATEGEEAVVAGVATAHKAVDVVLDGDLSEWNLDSPLILDGGEAYPLDNGTTWYSQLVRDYHFWNGPDDLSAKIYVAWDETYLYLGADVTEDSIFGAIETLPLDGVDNFQLYLSTNPADDPARTEYASNDFKVFLIMDGEYWDTAIDRSMVAKENRKRFISKGMDGGESVLDGYEVSAQQSATGFIYEAKIPWECFSNRDIAVYTPAVGDTINFDILITDISYPCPGTEYIPQMAWYGTNEIDKNPSQWGRLTFAE